MEISIDDCDKIVEVIDIGKMIDYLIEEPWHKDCVIITDYVAPHAKKGARPELRVRFNGFDDHDVFLRYSRGPKQGFFWDCYGEDFKSVELAILALSQAPSPWRAMVSFKISSENKDEDPSRV